MSSVRILQLACAMVVALAAATPSAAQQQSADPSATSLVADLLKDIDDVESKILGLARAIPADRYDWRPSPGARSVAEVLRHVAADNYLLPAAFGHQPDPATGIKGDDYKTAQAFEQRVVTRDENIAQLERSFAFAKQSLRGTTPTRMAEKVSLFGQQATVQYGWIVTATHLHEHLGQLIAYARSNNVVPPWSR